MKSSPLWPTAEKFPAMTAFVRDQAYPLLDHQPCVPVNWKPVPVESHTRRRTLVPPSSYSAMRSALPSKFASVAAHFIFPRSKDEGRLVYQSVGRNFPVTASRSRSWMRTAMLSAGSEIVTICVPPEPRKSPESGTPAAGVCASAAGCAGVALGVSRQSETTRVRRKEMVRRLDRVNELARR